MGCSANGCCEGTKLGLRGVNTAHVFLSNRFSARKQTPCALWPVYSCCAPAAYSTAVERDRLEKLKTPRGIESCLKNRTLCASPVFLYISCLPLALNQTQTAPHPHQPPP